MSRFSLADLLAQLAPEVQKAFLEAISDLRSDVRIAAIEDAIRRQDAAAVFRILHLEDAYFAPLDSALRRVSEAGGAFVFEEVRRQAGPTGATAIGRFDIRNPAAEEIVRSRAGNLITGLVREAQDVVNDAIRAGLERQTAPRTLALDIVGRSPVRGSPRRGGLVGLSGPQAGYVRRALEELTSGDPAQLRHYLTRGRRDRRFDGMVRRAIREERGLTATEARRVAGRYSDRLLQLRGETIGRTEALSALHEGRAEGLRQMVADGKVEAEAIAQEWDASADKFTRDGHRAMDGQRRKIGEPFVDPLTGAQMMHPMDRSLGAGPGDVINCRCVLKTRIDTVRGLRERLSPEELAEARRLMAEEG